jgi:predicted transcriptional regulator
MKRNRHEIISKILSVCIGEASKTRIVYQANLNFRTVNPYLDLLIKANMIEVRHGQRTLYETTQKGINLMKSLNQIHTVLDDQNIASYQLQPAISV